MSGLPTRMSLHLRYGLLAVMMPNVGDREHSKDSNREKNYLLWLLATNGFYASLDWIYV